MTLFDEIKGFLGRFVSNPLVLMAIAWMVYKAVKKHNPKEGFTMIGEAVKVKHLPDGTDVLTDQSTGGKVSVKGDKIKILSEGSKLYAIKEALDKEKLGKEELKVAAARRIRKDLDMEDINE